MDKDSTKDVSKLEEQFQQLQENYEDLKVSYAELYKKMNQLRDQREEMKKEIERLHEEKESLHTPPLTIMSVIDIFEDDRLGEGVEDIKASNDVRFVQIGQEDGRNFVTQIQPEMESQLSIGDNVIVDQEQNIISSVQTNTDADIQEMIIQDSPDVTFSDIGGLDSEIEQTIEAVQYPLTQPERLKDVGIDPPNGVLLYGPPGTGKTMIARAIANETDATFIHLSASSLVEKYIGDGAKKVRNLFSFAEGNAPAIIFMDELEAIASLRGDTSRQSTGEVDRTLTELLTQLDGFEKKENISFVGATNKEELIDDAILRPGRIDRKIEITPPETTAEIQEIVSIHTQDVELDPEIDLRHLSSLFNGKTGAEIKNTINEAGMISVKEGRKHIAREDFVQALERTDDSVDNNNSGTRSFA